MAATASYNNHSLVGKALKLLAIGLGPYVTSRLRHAVANGQFTLNDTAAVSEIAGDVAVMLRVMTVAWNDVFRDGLGQTERSLVSEIREIRNRWAHQETFNDDDLDRALDSVARLLTAVAAAREAEVVNRAKHRLRRKRYGAPPPQAAPTATVPASVPESPSAAVATALPDPTPAAAGDVGAHAGNDHAPLAAAHAGGDPAPHTATQASDNPGAHAGDESPPHPVIADVADNHIRRGVDQRRQGNFGPAITEFDLAIGISPDNADAWYHRALAWGHMGDHHRAVIDFDHAIELSPEYAAAYSCRGYARFRLGEYARAIADLERAISLNPDDPLTQTNLEVARRHSRGHPGSARPDGDTRRAARFTDLSPPASGRR